MTPELNRIYHGECIEIMRSWPDASIDLIFTDPPYGHKNNDGDLIHNREAAASDFRGGRTWEAGEKAGRGPTNNLRDFCRQIFGWTYPKPRFLEWMMGWDIGWTALDVQAMEWFQKKRPRRSRKSKTLQESK